MSIKKKVMKPQKDEPCNNCKNWKNGCKHYNSTSMIIFGCCGYKKPKE